MKILIDVGHPAHVHYFRNLAKIFEQKGAQVLFSTRDKEVTLKLLDYYRLKYINIGKPFRCPIGKIWGIFWFTLRLYLIALKFKPDIYLNASIYVALISKLFNKPHISLEDTFNMEQVFLYRPFTNVILTGDYSHPRLGEKEILYSSYQELAYLHPNYFIPDEKVLDLLGVKKEDKYIILRFVAWTASHDYGHKGISFENKIKAIKEFENYARVFISSEAEPPNELKSYKITLPPHKLHDALAFSSLVWAESFTIPAECSVLGVPSVINHNTKSYYLHEQEHKYNLCFNYSESETDQLKAIDKCIELLQSDNRAEWRKRRDIMLAEKIDVTSLLVWFIENYPSSAEVMRQNPDYQNRFR